MNAFDWKSKPSEVVIKDPRPVGEGVGSNFRDYEAKNLQLETTRLNHRIHQKKFQKQRTAMQKNMSEWSPRTRHQEVCRCQREIARHADLAKTDTREYWQKHHAAKVIELIEKVARLEAIDAAKKAVLEAA